MQDAPTLTPGRRDDYLVSYLVQRKIGRKSTDVRFGSITVRSFSKFEAEGRAREAIRRKYPAAEGWPEAVLVITLAADSVLKES